MKVLGEGMFALSSNCICMAIKPDTIIINHLLELSGTRVKYLDHEAGSSLTGVTALWSLSKTHLS